MSLFSVIIPTYQRSDDLRSCLNHLAPGEQSLPFDQYEVIVTDDEGSGSSSEKLVHSDFPWATWVTGPGRGVAANRNNGAAHARNEWLVFTDDDCRPCDNWLSAYHSAVQKEPSKVLEGKTIADRTAPGPGWTAPINHSGGKLWSCNFAVRHSFYKRIGGFDEGYPTAGVEDIDFRVRVLMETDDVHFVPLAQVVHPWREVSPLARQIRKAKAWNRFFRKFPDRARLYNYKYHVTALAGLLRWLPLAPFKKEWRREAGAQSVRLMKSTIILWECLKNGYQQ